MQVEYRTELRYYRLGQSKNEVYCDYAYLNDIRFFKSGNYWLNHDYGLLHRYHYELETNTKIPNGYDIHHIDFNHDNNSIENYQLLTHLEHLSLHSFGENNINFNNHKPLSKSHKQKISDNNTRPMTGRSVYSVWLEKYGEDIANEKYIQWKKNISIGQLNKKSI